MHQAALPEKGISPNFDGAGSWCEFAGVVQNIDQNLLDLVRFEVAILIRGNQLLRNRNLFFVAERSDFMHGMMQTRPQVAFLQIGPGFYLTSHAQLEHCGSHARKASRAVLHPLENFPLILVDGTQRFTEQQPAVSAQGRKGSTEVVNRTGQEIGTVVVVFLKPQIGLNEALKDFVTIDTQRVGCPARNRQPEKSGERGSRDRFQQNVRFSRYVLLLEAGQVLTVDDEQVLGVALVQTFGNRTIGLKIPNIKIGRFITAIFCG